MGKQTVSVDSDDGGSDNENADVEYEEVSEEEEPSEEEPSEEDPGEDELQEVDSCEEPGKDSCRGNEENSCTQQQDDVASCEVDPNEEDSFEEEPYEDVSSEEVPDEVNSCGTTSEDVCTGEQSEDACTGEQSEESCEEEPYEDDEQCEEGTIDEDSCEEVPIVEKPCEEPCEQEPVEDEPEEDEPEEEEPSEDPEEEPCEGSPVSSSFNRNNENFTQSNFRNMNMSSGPKRISDLSSIRNSYNNVIVQEKQAITGSTGKKRHSKWDIKDEGNKLPKVGGGIARKKRKTRWSRCTNDNSQFRMGAALKSPGIGIDLEIPKLHAQLLEIGKKLRSGVVDDRPLSERSPSPPPIYNNLGLKINTREARLRSKLMIQRQTIISELIQKSPNFKPPPDYKSCKLQKRLYIPSKEYPGYNFVRLILGPCGNTRKRMEEETGAKILIRGGKSRQNKRRPSDKKKLHILIVADDRYSMDAAVAMVEKILIPVEDGHNIHKLSQLRELAELKGTLRGTNTSNSRSSDPCDICGDASHPTSVCPLTDLASGANSVGHQVNFFAEMGGGLSSFNVPPLPVPIVPPVVANSALQVSKPKKNISKPKKKIDDANLFVGHIQSMDDDKLMELFSPFGPLCEAKVIRDRKTGLSKGYGFVKYTDSISAAKAVAHMNGYNIDGKMLAVRVAGANTIGQQVNFAEMGGELSSFSAPPLPVPTMPPVANSTLQVSKPKKKIDDANLFVGQLQSMDDNKLMELFSPFGLLCEAKVIRDRKTGLSKGYGFVKYADSISAAKAVAHMDGYNIDGKMLTVRIAGVPPVQSNRGSGVLLGQIPIYPGPAAIAQSNPEPMHWSGPPESRLPETLSSYSYSGSSFSNSSALPIRSTPFNGQYSMSSGPSCQTPLSASLFSGDLAVSRELAQFPGYLKSLNPPAEAYYYKSTPSTSLSSSQNRFTQNFGTYQMPPT